MATAPAACSGVKLASYPGLWRVGRALASSPGPEGFHTFHSPFFVLSLGQKAKTGPNYGALRGPKLDGPERTWTGL